MSTGLSLTFGLYVLGLVGIGAYFFWRTDTRRLSDYMLAGRDVGTWPIALSEVASVASGWTFFAWVGVGFTTGLHGLWFSMGMLVVVLFAYRYVAPSFRRQSERLDSQTVVVDVLEASLVLRCELSHGRLGSLRRRVSRRSSRP